MQRVLGWSRFVFGCHKAINARKRDKGREGDNQKSTNSTKYIKI